MNNKPKLIKLLNPELSTLTGGRNVSDLQAIVNHWTAAPGQDAIVTIKYCLFTTKHAYHYFVDRDGTIYQFTPFPIRADHCGANVYTQPAITRFKKYCPTTDHRVIPHKNTPNNVTLGICTAVEDDDGRMTDECYRSLVLINAYSINNFNPNLDPLNDVILHSFFTSEKECHKWFVRNPDKFIKFKQDIKHTVDIYDDSMIDVVTDYGYMIDEKLGFIKTDINK